MTNTVDTGTCWYQANCADEMNRFYDREIKNHDLHKHMGAFTTLLARTGLSNVHLIDLGCGTGMLSDFCKDFNYVGADLPNIIGSSSMRNYPQYMYRASDLTKDDLAWIHGYPIAILNGVIDIMQYPLETLERILIYCQEYLIVHRQEITEAGETHSEKNGPGYGGLSFHSKISRKDFIALIDRLHFDIVQEINLEFKNWENGGTSFLLRRRKSWSLNGMDYALYQKYFLGKENGFFIEAGANDGLTQSNTYYFEFYKNWKGILIEPTPEQVHQCKQNRSPQTKVVQSAITDDKNRRLIDMIYTPSCKGLMSVIDDDKAEYLMKRVPNPYGIPMIVPACTLNSILHDYYATAFQTPEPIEIDLLVLDVEGHELKALKGLDLQTPLWNIRYLLIEELLETDEIQSYLAQFGYVRIEKLSHHDYLYKKG